MKQLGLYGSQVDAKNDRETAAETCGFRYIWSKHGSSRSNISQMICLVFICEVAATRCI